MSTQALVLDFGGPVLLTPFELVVDEPGTPAHGLLFERGPLATAEHPDPIWQDLQAGRITEREYWAQRAVEWDALGGHGADIRAMIAHLYEPPRPALIRELARRLVADARAAGILVSARRPDCRARRHAPHLRRGRPNPAGFEIYRIASRLSDAPRASAPDATTEICP